MYGLACVISTFCLTLFSLAVAAAEVPFSTNDLSILFPIDAGNTNVPKFVVQPGKSTWRVFSLTNFSEVMRAAADEKVHLTDKLKDPPNWYLVGMRYAPCTLFHGSSPNCKEQLRFIFQSLNAERGGSGFDDYAMHVVYNFSDQSVPKPSKILESFRVIKNRFPNLNLDKFLAVSPALQSAQSSEYFNALQTEVIEKYVNTRNPSVITFVGLGGTGSNDDHWVFLTGDVNANGHWAIAPLNVGAPFLSEHLRVTEDFDLTVNISAKPEQFSLFNNEPVADNSLLLKILDQRQSNDHNVSCASCHVADTRMFPVMFMDDQTAEKQTFLKDMMGVLKNKSRVSELLVENKTHVGKIGFEAPAVRIFGYLDGRVLLSQRVVMDSALAVEQANALLGLLPKPQCKSEAERKALLSCVYLMEAGTSLSECMASACLD